MENHLDTVAVAAVIFGAGSEIIGMSKLKSNSWVQLGLQVGKLMLPPPSSRRR
jgi:hypothetical protein